jgi:hypothetical protein
MAAMMLMSTAAVASADSGTIPLYADSLNAPALKSIPTVYTEHKEDKYGRGTTTLWSSMVLDSASVMVYDASKHYNVPVALDLVDGTSATYSTTGLKRQPGITYSGSWKETKVIDPIELGLVNVGTYKSEDEMYKEVIKDYANKGWDSDDIVVEPEYVTTKEVLNFYVDVNGKDTYVGFYDVTGMKDDKERATAAQNVINYLVKDQQYNPDALSYTYVPTVEKTGEYTVYIPGETQTIKHAYAGGDDCYYLTVGNQTSLHGRSGKVYEVKVAVDEDLFNTDLEFVNGTVTYKKNGNTGAWYIANATMNYSETSAVRALSANYLPTYDLKLQGYTVTINANGTTYRMDYNAYGGFETGSAYNAAGSFKTKAVTAFDWVNTASWKYVRNFSLLSIKKLNSLFTRKY